MFCIFNSLFLSDSKSVINLARKFHEFNSSDSGFEADSKRIFEAARQSKIVVLISELIMEELRFAPEQVQELVRKIPRNALELVSINSDVLDLRSAYLKAKILGAKSRNDATHVDAATTARADAIISWNFKHIVRLDKMKGFNRVNFEFGYSNLIIINPKEFYLDEEEGENFGRA